MCAAAPPATPTQGPTVGCNHRTTRGVRSRSEHPPSDPGPNDPGESRITLDKVDVVFGRSCRAVMTDKAKWGLVVQSRVKVSGSDALSTVAIPDRVLVRCTQPPPAGDLREPCATDKTAPPPSPPPASPPPPPASGATPPTTAKSSPPTQPPPSPPPTSKAAATVQESASGSWWWVWVLLGGLACVVVLILVLVLRGRRSEEYDETRPRNDGSDAPYDAWGGASSSSTSRPMDDYRMLPRLGPSSRSQREASH